MKTKSFTHTRLAAKMCCKIAASGGRFYCDGMPAWKLKFEEHELMDAMIFKNQVQKPRSSDRQIVGLIPSFPLLSIENLKMLK